MLKLTALSKRFGNVVAVEGVTLSVEQGSALAIIGPSGCGKTTLLRLIAGLEVPTSGQVAYRRRLLNHLPPGKRGVQLLFQAPMLYPFLTVRGNLRFPGYRQGDLDSRVLNEICEMLQINDLLDRRPQKISGGETQRVALARVLLRRSGVVLLDEPLSDVDPLLANSIRESAIKRLKDQDTAIVYVTHDQEEAAVVGDRIAVMRSGEIHQIGTARELYDGPTTEFVAKFISRGRFSIFEAVVRSTPVGLTILEAFGGNTQLHVPASMGSSFREGSRVRVMIRKGRLVPAARGMSPGPYTMGRIKRLDHHFRRTECLFETLEGEVWPIEIEPGTSLSIEVLKECERDDAPMAVDLGESELLIFSDTGLTIGKVFRGRDYS